MYENDGFYSDDVDDDDDDDDHGPPGLQGLVE